MTGTVRRHQRSPLLYLANISITVQLWILVFWVISVQFDLRNTLPKSGPFLLLHSVYFELIFFVKFYIDVCGSLFERKLCPFPEQCLKTYPECILFICRSFVSKTEVLVTLTICVLCTVCQLHCGFDTNFYGFSTQMIDGGQKCIAAWK